MVGTERDNILTAVSEILKEKLEPPIKSPFGDGDVRRENSSDREEEIELKEERVEMTADCFNPSGR